MKASVLNLAKTYFGLTKPERTITNTVTAIAGFLFASQWHIDWPLFIRFAGGLTLVIASACVLNNYIDKGLDLKMERTKNRALPSGKVSAAASIIYGLLLGALGFWLLSYTNRLTMAVVAVAYIFYVAIYGLAKRYTVHSTLIGTVPGGASMVAGYTAVANQLDSAALILFLIMLSWQMVHFYAIAIFRQKDYAAAKIPVLAVKKGITATKIQMLFYMAAFIFAASLLSWYNEAGYIYLAGMLLLALIWLRKVLEGFSANDNAKWARGVFKLSLVVLLAMSLLIATASVLP